MGEGSVNRTRSLGLLAGLCVIASTLTFGVNTSAASSAEYIVLVDQSRPDAAVGAIETAGGAVLSMNKVGIASVASANARFETAVQGSSAIVGAARNAGFALVGAKTAAVPDGTRSQVVEIAACASLYGVSAITGPDPLGPCQWDMRAIKATTSGSYAVNKGRGARVGVMDTGIDLNHGDVMSNVELAASCVFIYATTPTSLPAEQVT